jgi:hypothetical protein
MTESRYQEYAPAQLADFVDCFWTIRGAGTLETPNRVLPDNSVDVVFDFVEPDGGPRVVGAMLEAAVFRYDGPIDMLGVRFRPGAAPLFLAVASSELTGSIVAADGLWSDAASLDDQLRSCAMEQRIPILEEFLARRLRPLPHTDRARDAMAAIAESRGAISLATLCSMLSVSNRTLLRSFTASVGVAPRSPCASPGCTRRPACWSGSPTCPSRASRSSAATPTSRT